MVTAMLEEALKTGCNVIGPANLTLWYAALAGVHHLRVWVCYRSISHTYIETGQSHCNAL